MLRSAPTKQLLSESNETPRHNASPPRARGSRATPAPHPLVSTPKLRSAVVSRRFWLMSVFILLFGWFLVFVFLKKTKSTLKNTETDSGKYFHRADAQASAIVLTRTIPRTQSRGRAPPSLCKAVTKRPLLSDAATISTLRCPGWR